MKRLFAILAWCAVLAAPTFAQPPGPDVAAQKAMIAKVAWLNGEWEGRGWVDTEAGRQNFRQTERVETRLDGAILLVEGRGYSGSPETLAFDAFGILSHDDQSGRTTFRTYARGYVATAEAQIRPDGGLVWRMTPPGQVIRYTITRPQPDVWYEVGERSTDGGATFTRFFEMELTRKR